MKKLIISTFLLVSITLPAVLLMSGCSKDRIEQQLNTYSPVNTYLDTKKQQEQVFIIDTSGSGPITGNQGTNIWLGKQCLMYPNGDSVPWPFEVRLVELYKPKDMIYWQMPTVSAGTVLKTDGEIRLRCVQNNTDLLLKPDPCMAQIEMPNAAPQAGMRVFYGYDNSGKPDWNDDPSFFGITTSLNPVFSTTPIGYMNGICRLGWVNCGLLAGGSSGSSTISFTSSTDDLTNVGIFVYLPATKTVIQAYNMTTTAIPNGSNAKIVCIGVDGSGSLFSFTQTLTVSSNQSVDVVMSATTDAALTSVLDGL